MVTEIFSGDRAAEAGLIIQRGGLVVFPTETVYGLGADVFNEDACRRIFEAKGRPQDNPLIAHIYERSQLDSLVERFPPGAEILMDSFWPGPLTLVLPKKRSVNAIVTANLNTLGVRMPRHTEAFAFLKAAGTPVAAPSANQSGKPSPTNFAMAREAMEGRVEAILDGGACETGLESTVIAWAETKTGSGWTILRPGAVTREDLFSVLDTLFLQEVENLDEKLLSQSPGTHHPHYRPLARVRLFESAENFARGTNLTQVENIKSLAILSIDEINTEKTTNLPSNFTHRHYTSWIELARHLYSDFYELDALGISEILVQTPTRRGGIEEALKNRLLKASSDCWV